MKKITVTIMSIMIIITSTSVAHSDFVENICGNDVAVNTEKIVYMKKSSNPFTYFLTLSFGDSTLSLPCNNKNSRDNEYDRIFKLINFIP